MTIFIDDCLGTTIKLHLTKMGFDVVLHADLFSQGTEDIEWITHVAQKKWPVLTRDRQIKRNRLERQAVIEGPLNFFSLGSSSATLDTHIRVIQKHQVSIKALAQFIPAPFIVTMTLQDLKFEWLGDPNSIMNIPPSP